LATGFLTASFNGAGYGRPQSFNGAGYGRAPDIKIAAAAIV